MSTASSRMGKRPARIRPPVERGAGWAARSRVDGRTAIGAIVLAVFLAYFLLARPYHMRWGATDAEVAATLPGDEFIPAGAAVSTRGVTIDAPAAAVWPWIAQLGQQHGGFYTHDWLENLFAAKMRNAEEIRPEWQDPQVGAPVLLGEHAPVVPVISLIEPGRVLSLDGWTWYLQPVDERTTRLIVRYPSFPLDSTATRLYYYGFFEQAHFIMEAGMMLGIKQRAEAGSGGD